MPVQLNGPAVGQSTVSGDGRGVFSGTLTFGPGDVWYDDWTPTSATNLVYDTALARSGSEIALTVVGSGQPVNFGAAVNVGTVTFDPQPGRVNVMIFRFQGGRVLYTALHQFDRYTYLTFTGLTNATWDAPTNALTFTGGQGNAIAAQTFGTVDGSYLAWQTTNPDRLAGDGAVLWLDSDTTNPEAWGSKQHALYQSNGGIIYTQFNGTQQTETAPSDAINGMWFRLRVSGANLVYESSLNYVTWTTIRTAARLAGTVNIKAMHFNAPAARVIRNAHISLP